MNKPNRKTDDARRMANDGWRSRPLSTVLCLMFCVLLPFVVLHWMVPFVGKYTIGNDYLNYWINNQMFLMFSLSNGTFPLYAPGFNAGWTSSALTLGQLYHPISWLAAIIPGYWNGYAHQIGTILRLIELGGTGAVIFLFLRKLRLSVLLAFALSFTAVFNLRMLDMFRYGASLESYAAMLLLCTFLGWFYLSPGNRFLPFCVAIFSWLLVVGGHPQIAFIGFLGAAFVCIIFPFYTACLLPDEPKPELQRVFRFWGLSAVLMFFGILLASSFTLPFYFEYMQESIRGMGLDFGYACSCQDSVKGIVSNFFNPFFSDVHGAFGGSALALLAVLIPLAAVFYVRRAWPVLVLWAGCIIVLILSAGSNGPLYYYFWKYFPFAQSFRVPGRLCMVLPFMFMLILAWMLRQQNISLHLGKRQIAFNPVVLVSVVALILLIGSRSFDYSPLAAQGRYVPANLNNVPSAALSLFFICGLISLSAVALLRLSKKLEIFAAVILLASVLVASMDVLAYGTWIVPGNIKTKTFAQMQSEQRQRLSYRYPTGDLYRTLIVEHLIKRTFIEPGLARFCRRFESVGSRDESYERMSKLREIDLVYVEGFNSSAGQSLTSSPGIDSVELKYSSFNNLIFDVNCAQPGLFVFSFPYSPLWQAIVNGRNAHVYRCNAIEQGIWLSPGRHSVEFRYRSPATVAGFVLSGVTLVVLIGLFWPGKKRWIVVSAMVFLSLILFSIWYRSLYRGGNIGTYYLWTSQQIQPNLSSKHNLAYGKKASMSEAGVESYFTDSSCGVDGDRTGSFGFRTDVQEHAFWQVDLDENVPIGEIDVYKMRDGRSSFAIPFDVMFSQDGNDWSRIGTVETDTPANCWRLYAGVKTRYIRLQTRNVGFLAFSEVEVYPP